MCYAGTRLPSSTSHQLASFELCVFQDWQTTIVSEKLKKEEQEALTEQALNRTAVDDAAQVLLNARATHTDREEVSFTTP